MAIVPSDSPMQARPSAERRARLLQPEIQQGEETLETSLRPRQLKHYLGQEEMKQSLGIAIAAAKARSEALDHLLFYGPPGLGKTTISMLIAAEMGSQIRITSARPGAPARYCGFAGGFATGRHLVYRRNPPS